MKINQLPSSTATVYGSLAAFALLVAMGSPARTAADTTIEVLHITDGTNGTIDDGVVDGAQGGTVRYNFDGDTYSGGGEPRIREWTNDLSQGTTLWRALFYYDLPAAPAGEMLDSAVFSTEVQSGVDQMGDYKVGLYHLPGYNNQARSGPLLPELWGGFGVGEGTTRLGTLMENEANEFYGGMTVSADASSALQDEYLNDPSMRIWLMASFETDVLDEPITETSDNGISEAIHFIKTASKLTLEFVSDTTPVLAGDYNGNGIVDAADYTVWRDNVNLTGTPGSVPGDGDNGTGTGTPDGVVDQADYDFWKSNYGTVASSSSSLSTIPEPSAIVLFSLAGISLSFRLRHSSSEVS